jgi:hypothetical protein
MFYKLRMKYLLHRLNRNAPQGWNRADRKEWAKP